tara:strand:+ start:6623 stop:7021 length:399 start_codon:yes stop_codon:yes gene_type:complete
MPRSVWNSRQEAGFLLINASVVPRPENVEAFLGCRSSPVAEADTQKAAKICVQGRTYDARQTCVAAKRFIFVEAVRLARDEFDIGMVNINGHSVAQPNLPFGRVKQSGYGREHDDIGIHEFVNVKTIVVSQS